MGSAVRPGGGCLRGPAAADAFPMLETHPHVSLVQKKPGAITEVSEQAFDVGIVPIKRRNGSDVQHHCRDLEHSPALQPFREGLWSLDLCPDQFAKETQRDAREREPLAETVRARHEQTEIDRGRAASRDDRVESRELLL